jgi:hypothetical protein
MRRNLPTLVKLHHRIEAIASADLLTYVLRIPVGQQRRDHSMQLATTMKLLGWDRPAGKGTINDKPVRGYTRRVDRRGAG